MACHMPINKTWVWMERLTRLRWTTFGVRIWKWDIEITVRRIQP